jgi:steroid delta-isomerase-like uncharacterized protein
MRAIALAALLPGLALLGSGAASAQSAPPRASPAGAPHGLALVAVRPAPADGDVARRTPAIVKAWIAAWNGGDPKAMAALFTEDGVYDDHAFQVRSEGRAAIATFVAITNGNMPGAKAEIVDVFQAGDRIAIEWIFNGTPLRFGPTPLTGKSFSVPVVTILRMKGDRIQHDDDFYNLADVFRQLGLPAGPWTPPAP